MKCTFKQRRMLELKKKEKKNTNKEKVENF